MKTGIKRALGEFILIVVIVVLVGGGSFYFGRKVGESEPKTIIVKGITNIGDDDVEADFDVFWETWRFIRDEHIDGEEVDNQELIYGSIAGMVESLDDPNSIFFPPEDAKKFREDVSGSFGGIGTEIGIRKNQLVVIAPLKDTPADRAGLKSGDKILKVDDTITAGMNVHEAVKIIRGPEGEEVVLTMFRDEWDDPKEISIIRERIEIPTLDREIIDEDIVHIKLYTFNKNAPFLFYQAIVGSLLEGAKGVILDLRNNPGGFLEISVNLAGWFLERGDVVVTERFRSGEEKIFRADGNEILKNFPTVILINGGSASASEILSGALRDHRGVKLIGEKSFGKGSVQELKVLRDSSSLKLTVANWVLPSGEIIEGNGLEPDFEVTITEEDIDAEKDPQLEKAIEVLRSEIAE